MEGLLPLLLLGSRLLLLTEMGSAQEFSSKTDEYDPFVNMKVYPGTDRPPPAGTNFSLFCEMSPRPWVGNITHCSWTGPDNGKSRGFEQVSHH